MFPKMRNFYKLEKKYKDAPVVDISAWVSQSNENDSTEVEDGESMSSIFQNDEDDPFWSN